jgi:hypothetical protein
VADGNGWEQNHESGFYYPSKRSKLNIRMPQEKLAEAEVLVGKTLNLGDTLISNTPALASFSQGRCLSNA